MTATMTRADVAAELGCGMQQRWVWGSGGNPVALVLRESLNPALPERVCVGDGAHTRAQAHRVDGLTLPVYSHDGKGTYRVHGQRTITLDSGAGGKDQAAADAAWRTLKEGSLYGVLHLRA